MLDVGNGELRLFQDQGPWGASWWEYIREGPVCFDILTFVVA